MKRLRFLLFAIPVCLISVLIIGAQRSHPANAGGVIDPTCVSSLPCIEYDNNGTGHAIQGIALNGHGIAGGTKNKSTSASNGRAGIFGNDLSTSGAFNSGVKGISTNGIGVSGLSTNGTGVTGQSTNAPGSTGTSSNNDGIDGFTTNPSLTRSPRSGVFGFDNSSDGGHGNGGVVGFSINGVGVAGNSNNWVGVNAVGGDTVGSDLFPALSVVGNTAGGIFGNDLIDACKPGTANPCDNVHSIFSVDGFGAVTTGAIFANSTVNSLLNFNIVGSGAYLKNGTCVAGCTAATSASAGRAVVTYAPMVTQPTVEDFGESQLVNGQASVRLDPKFANVVDQRANYLVFITPEGDANTLYVTQKSMGGFAVRESHGGRSTLMFSYRIVAKPFGSREARLPIVDLPKLRSSAPKQRAWHSGGIVPVR